MRLISPGRSKYKTKPVTTWLYFGQYERGRAEPCIGKGGLSNRGGWAGAAQPTIPSGHEVLADRYRCDLKASKPLESTVVLSTGSCSAQRGSGARLLFEDLLVLPLWERRL